MAKPRLVFVTERGARHQEDARAIVPEGVDIVFLRSPETDALASALSGATYLVSERAGVVDRHLIEAAPDLQLILRLGSLTHDIDLQAARQRGVIVCQRRQAGAIAVAEFVVLQILALMRRLSEAEAIAREAGDGWADRRTTDEDNFAYNWSDRRGHVALDGMNIGLLGFGEIGAELARRLTGWDVATLYARRRRLPESVERDLAIVHRDNEALIAQSDVVVNLLPFTTQTAGYLDRERLSTMKPGALLVSAGSGGVIDETGLGELLENGHLAGAALDTFAVEPIEPGNPLVDLARGGANLLLTPHVAGGAPAGPWTGFEQTFAPIVEHMRGALPTGRID